jgi:chromosome segregation ATPase
MLSMLIIVLVSGLATIGVVLMQQRVRTASSGIANLESTSNAKDSIKTITQQIVKLEIQRAMLEPVFGPGSSVMNKIESQIGSLQQRLSQIQSDGKGAVVNRAVFEAIKAKIAELEVKRALLEPVFTPEAPVMQKIESQLKSLRQRIAQIQPNNQVAVNHAISEAIKAKIAELKAERSLQETQDSPTSPTLSSIDSKLKSLEKRLVLQ